MSDSTPLVDTALVRILRETELKVKLTCNGLAFGLVKARNRNALASWQDSKNVTELLGAISAMNTLLRERENDGNAQR